MVLAILGPIALGLLIMVIIGHQRSSKLASNYNQAKQDLETTTTKLADCQKKSTELENRRSSAEATAKQIEAKLTETSENLRKRTELADAQAIQISTISSERDDIQNQLNTTKEQLATVASRPQVVVADTDDETNTATMLWDLELARSERLWRNSVALNPIDDDSPFTDTDDPVRLAVEIEAAALREDVGALINIDWRAKPIQTPGRQLIVARVAQELLSNAAKAPGAATLIVTGDKKNHITMQFESDTTDNVINLIPPQVAGDLVEVSSETTLTIKP